MFTASLDILSNLPWQASACWQEPGHPGLMPCFTPAEPSLASAGLLGSHPATVAW
jgi:hypothetical protein